jgi:putative glutathione S-transferase
MGSNGWPFNNIDSFPGATEDPNTGASHMKDLYLSIDPEFKGRFTVPVLWDKQTNSIVNNESAEIIRIFNTAFNELLPKEKAEIDLYPENLRKEIDETNEWVYDTVNSAYLGDFLA